MGRRYTKFRITLAILFTAIYISADRTIIGLIIEHKGDYTLFRNNRASKKSKQKLDFIHSGTGIRTQRASQVDLKYIDDACFIRMSAESEILLSAKRLKGAFKKVCLLKQGNIWVEVKAQAHQTRIGTDFGTFACSQAKFYLSTVPDQECKVWVLDGEVTFEKATQKATIKTGETGILTPKNGLNTIKAITTDIPGFGRDTRKELTIPFKNENDEQIKLIITFIKK